MKRGNGIELFKVTIEKVWKMIFINVWESWRKTNIKAGFTYRLKPRASRSKGDLLQTVVSIESMASIWSF